MATRTCANNSSLDEITMLVDLLHKNKFKLLGSCSSSSSNDEKNHVLENLAKKISEAHGTFRNKEVVSKK